MSYVGNTLLISGVRAKTGDFPVADAAGIYVDDDTRLGDIVPTAGPAAEGLDQGDKRAANAYLFKQALDGKFDQPYVVDDEWTFQKSSGGAEMDAFMAGIASVTVTAAESQGQTTFTISGYDATAFYVPQVFKFGTSLSSFSFYVYATDTTTLYGSGVAQHATVAVPAQVDAEPTKDSVRLATSGGIWKALWGALSALPSGVASIYDWVISLLSGKLDKSGGEVTGALTVLKLIVGNKFSGVTIADSSNSNNATKYGYNGVTVLREGVGDDYGFDNSQDGIARLKDITVKSVKLNGKTLTPDNNGAVDIPPETELAYALPDECFPITYTENASPPVSRTITSNAGIRFESVSSDGTPYIVLHDIAAEAAGGYGYGFSTFNKATLKWDSKDAPIDDLLYNNVAPVSNVSPALLVESVLVRDVEVAKKSDLWNLVHTTGNEIVGGVKTFTSNVEISNNKKIYLYTSSPGLTGSMGMMLGIDSLQWVGSVPGSRYTVYFPTTDGTLALLSDAMRFSIQASYAVGDVVFYNGAFYRCTSAHTAGAWNASHFEEVIGGISTGTPTAPTPASGDNSTKLATTAFVKYALPYVIVGVDIISTVSDGIVTRTAGVGNRNINVITNPIYDFSLTLPSQTDTRSRDFYVAVTCNSTVPTMAVSDATLINTKGETNVSLALTANATTVFHFTEVANGSTGVDPVFVVTGGANGGGSVDPAQLAGKLDSTAAGPAYDPTDTTTAYAVGYHVTYNGVLYECMVAVTSSSTTPDQDIYDDSTTPATGHWKATDMTTPDATLDVTSAGSLRVVAADGTVLWQQGYRLKTESSSTLDNEAGNRYGFAQDATDIVALTLPAYPAGKVGDFILAVTNPQIGVEFSSTASYAEGARVIYQGAVYTCSAAHTGEWSGGDFALVYDAWDSETSYPYGTVVAKNGSLYKCREQAGSTLGWYEDEWTTASFNISGLGTTLKVVVPKGENITDMLTFAPGAMCELYFTLTSFAVGGLPTWKIVRQDVEEAV